MKRVAVLWRRLFIRPAEPDALAITLVPGVGCVDQDGLPVLTMQGFPWEEDSQDVPAGY